MIQESDDDIIIEDSEEDSDFEDEDEDKDEDNLLPYLIEDFSKAKDKDGKGTEIITELYTRTQQLEKKLFKLQKDSEEGRTIKTKRACINAESLLEKILIIESFIEKNKIGLEKSLSPLLKDIPLTPSKKDSKEQNVLLNDLKELTLSLQKEANNTRNISEQITYMTKEIISLEAVSLKDALKLYGTTKAPKYKQFEIAYKEYELKIIDILQRVSDLYNDKKERKSKEKIAFKRYLRLLKEVIKARSKGATDTATYAGPSMEDYFKGQAEICFDGENKLIQKKIEQLRFFQDKEK